MNPDTAADEVQHVPRLRRVSGWVLFTAIALVVVYFTWPSSLGGCTTLTIVSGHSMEPTYYTNDIVVSRCGTPEVGDIAVYATEDTGGARIVHRVIGGDGASGWQFQGDNNDFVDEFHPTNDDVLGTAVLHIPKAGLVAKTVSSPLVWLSLFVLATALFVWPARDDEAEREDEPKSEHGGAVAAPEPALAAHALAPEPRVVDDFRMEDLDEYIAARAAEPLAEEPLPGDDPTRVLSRSVFDFDELLESATVTTTTADDDWWTPEIEALVFPDKVRA